MMKLDAVKFAYAAGKDNPTPAQDQLDLARCPELVDALQCPIAYVVRNEDLDSLREAEPPKYLEYHGKKTGAELSRILLRCERIPFLKTSYSIRGKLISSIRDLLTRAASINERNIYLIGIPEELFAKLWNYAGRLAEVKDTGAADGSGQAEPWEVIYERLKHQYIPTELRDEYIGNSKRGELVRHLIVRASQSDANVLVLGDTGTGKEIVASWIHYLGPRKTQHFEAVNCAGIPEHLLESELFGHLEGSFTDAKFDKVGKWPMAHNGTLFLDEIGDLDLTHQAKILRALEDGKITPVGATETVKVDARVIAATNRNLREMVKNGSFREDLLFRLQTFLIPAPALYQHLEDIPPIANHLWKKITKDDKAELPQEVIDELLRRRWPGNAREIKAVLTCVYGLVGKDDVDAEILRAVLDQQGNSPRSESEK